MVRNVGGVDRMLRIFFGAMLVALALFSTHEYAVWGWLRAYSTFYWRSSDLPGLFAVWHQDRQVI